MKKQKLDEETQDIVNKGRQLSELVEHEGWPLFMDKVDDLIEGLKDINNLTEGTSPEEIAREIAGKKYALNFMLQLFDDVQGDLTKFTATNEMLSDDSDDNYIQVEEE
jgi:predicted RND superfamily exporter protein